MGDHLRTRRLDLGLRRRDVAARLGANPTTVNNWELKHTEPEIRFLPGIIHFLGYSPIAESQTIADDIQTGRMTRGLSQQKWPRS